MSEPSPSAFPGVARWLVLRHAANVEREASAFARLEAARVGAVVDVALAGCDWPYGAPLSVDLIERCAAEHAMGAGAFRVLASPEPPGVVVRVRADSRGAALGFVRALSDAVREARERVTAATDAVPLAALCAHFATLRSAPEQVRWAGFASMVGLAAVDEDAVALAMAAWVSSFVMDLPELDVPGVDGDRALDLALDRSFTMATGSGRARLRTADQMLRALDPALALRVDPGGPYAAGATWSVVGFGAGRCDPAKRAVVEAVLPAAVLSLPRDESHLGAEEDDPQAFLARVGHAALHGASRVAEGEAPLELARRLALEHAVAAGFDARVRRFAAALLAHPAPSRDDFALALGRLASIDGDPAAVSDLLAPAGALPVGALSSS